MTTLIREDQSYDMEASHDDDNYYRILRTKSPEYSGENYSHASSYEHDESSGYLKNRFTKSSNVPTSDLDEEDSFLDDLLQENGDLQSVLYRHQSRKDEGQQQQQREQWGDDEKELEVQKPVMEVTLTSTPSTVKSRVSTTCSKDKSRNRSPLAMAPGQVQHHTTRRVSNEYHRQSLEEDDPALLTVAQKASLFRKKMIHRESDNVSRKTHPTPKRGTPRVVNPYLSKGESVVSTPNIVVDKENRGPKVKFTRSTKASPSPLKNYKPRTGLSTLNVNTYQQQQQQQRQPKPSAPPSSNDTTISSITLNTQFSESTYPKTRHPRHKISNISHLHDISPRTAKHLIDDNPATRSAFYTKEQQFEDKPYVFFAGRLGTDRFNHVKKKTGILQTWSNGMGYVSPTHIVKGAVGFQGLLIDQTNMQAKDENEPLLLTNENNHRINETIDEIPPDIPSPVITYRSSPTDSHVVTPTSSNIRDMHVYDDCAQISQDVERAAAMNKKPNLRIDCNTDYVDDEAITQPPSTNKSQITQSTLDKHKSLLLIDESCIDSIMDDLESEIDDFDLAMMNNHSLKNLLVEETPARPPQLGDVFSLSPSQDEVVEIDTVIHDIMTKGGTHLSYSEDEVVEAATEENMEAMEEHYTDEPTTTSKHKSKYQKFGCVEYVFNPFCAARKKKQKKKKEKEVSPCSHRTENSRFASF